MLPEGCRRGETPYPLSRVTASPPLVQLTIGAQLSFKDISGDPLVDPHRPYDWGGPDDRTLGICPFLSGGAGAAPPR